MTAAYDDTTERYGSTNAQSDKLYNSFLYETGKYKKHPVA